MKKRRLGGLLVAVFIGTIILVAGGLYLRAYITKPRTLTATSTARLTELEQIKNSVGKLILLPTDEEPALATITDKEKLATPFLAKGQNGDKVLLYSNAQRVFIYRPSENKLVDVGPLNIVPVQ